MALLAIGFVVGMFVGLAVGAVAFVLEELRRSARTREAGRISGFGDDAGAWSQGESALT